ncbi:uncharacterized protein LOC143919581 [Arctopsyche grandis]|uniref:uncharacterized protein LOC143919581 n=1 Tax=Arctopsyche grandis TaxID=121162 RepID=UPI00406D8150
MWSHARSSTHRTVIQHHKIHHTPPQHHHHHHHQGPVRLHERRHAETGGSATTPPRATTTHSPARSIINHIDAPAAPAAPPTDISLGRAAPAQHRIGATIGPAVTALECTDHSGQYTYTADDPLSLMLGGGSDVAARLYDMVEFGCLPASGDQLGWVRRATTHSAFSCHIINTCINMPVVSFVHPP